MRISTKIKYRIPKLKKIIFFDIYFTGIYLLVISLYIQYQQRFYV
jgi:hypothetical protein